MNEPENAPRRLLTIVVGILVILALLSPLHCRISLSIKSSDPNDPNIVNVMEGNFTDGQSLH